MRSIIIISRYCTVNFTLVCSTLVLTIHFSHMMKQAAEGFFTKQISQAYTSSLYRAALQKKCWRATKSTGLIVVLQKNTFCKGNQLE